MAAQRRRELEAMRQKWLRDRAIDQERQEVKAELISSSNNQAGSTTGANVIQTHSSQKNNVSNSEPAAEDVINRVAERLSDRLRVEIRKEILAEAKKDAAASAAVGKHLEGFLAQEIEQHCCPICLELMAPPSNAPVLLFPCGHTFCASCVKAQSRTAHHDKCACCRAKITSTAPNISLQNIIENFLKKRSEMTQQQRNQHHPPASSSQSNTDSSATHEFGSGIDANAEKYYRDYRAFSIRCEVLRNEMEELLTESEALKSKRRSGRVVLGQLATDKKRLEAEIQRMQMELQLTVEHMHEQEARLTVAEEEWKTNDKRLQVVESTLQGVVQQKDKCKLLVRGLAPQLVAELSDDDGS
jgi:hypothetical protein